MPNEAIVERRSFLASMPLALAQITPQEGDDWQDVPRVVAVGDIHGDIGALIAVLNLAGIIDGLGHWNGGSSHLVQIGDIPARGTQVRECFDFLMKLEKEAAQAGGRVHALIGNHDAGVIHGDLRSTLPEEYLAFRTAESEPRLEEAFAAEVASRKRLGQSPAGAQEQEYERKTWFERHPPGFAEHREAFSPSGPYGSWIRRNNAVLRINDTLFVHGGISPKYVRTSRQELNSRIRRELADPARLLPGTATDTQGPLWYRGFAEESGRQVEEHLQAVLAFHGVRRIVFGHTVTRTAILPRFGGRAINIDIGLSKFYGRPPACLVLERNSGHVLHRDKRIPLPGARPSAYLRYLRAIEAADEKPSPVTALIGDAGAGRQ